MADTTAAVPAAEEIWRLQMTLSEGLSLAEPDVPTAAAAGSAAGADAAAGDDGTKKKKYKWATSLDTAFKFNFETARQRPGLGDIAWDDSIKGVQRSQSGAEGVFFVDTDKGALVVKGSKTIASEVFASMLAYKLRIYLPRSRILPTESVEGAAMLERLKKLDPSGRVATNLHDLHYVLLKEYAGGQNLNQLQYEDASRIFGLCQTLHENGRKRLGELGALLALDLLMNNCDRLPLVWENQGNAGNVMLGLRDGQVISIDSQIICIDPAKHPENLAAYLAKVDALLCALVAKPDTEDSRMHTVRKVIMQNTDYDVGEDGSVTMQRGLLAVVASTAASPDASSSLAEESRHWLSTLRDFEPALVGVEQINVDFLDRTWAIFQKHAAAAARVIAGAPAAATGQEGR